MNNDIIIRLEEEKDYERVEFIHREAFWNQSVPGATEHYFAHMLRQHEDFIPQLDLVAEKDGKVIGSVMYSRARLVDEKGEEKEVISFGPIAVLPEHQRRGISRILLDVSFEKAAEMGFDTIVIFGNPSNYVGRGFKSSKKYNVCLEGDVFPCALLVKELNEGALDGRKWYYYGSSAEDCCNDAAAVEKFDAHFPPKKKEWKPCQEEFYIHSHSAVIW